ncbi:hypothetical protein DOTSEDRAFT_54997 [Dothistroma septosporum NZE10]|uniref:DUF1750-domain-containing protein n=1 Tax=Dothistroma septosporum (strain NZE10 / CBS 128990) TaxID=675120 RepID=N1PKU9_DOTSN|nr:hypothetical protein DOTSEDRAFT_54997 [Dothistroma septosporum NZE10]
MNDPSQGVAAPLQPHVHLVSLHRFPLIASLNLEQAYRYLLDAPSIVKQIAPMSWNYVQPPQDGTMWLEWIPQHKNEQPYATDGYVWGDPEQTFRQSVGGYTIEMRVHTVGFRQGYDQMATHARTRYHFIAKDPTVSAPHPDSNLWLVHYHQADQNRWMPSNQVPTTPQIQQTMAQRRWLESQGRLERRDFMLHDRDHWPTLNVPGQMQQSAQYGSMAMQNRYPQQQAAQTGGPPAAKRPRTQGPGLPGSSDGPPDTSIEIEEDTALGDFFDHLTQRDISVARYSQHHRWMEEVFSSPYATSQIVPPDLGMGLMGELKGLTDGILDPPSLDFKEVAEKPRKAAEPQPFTNLKKEQVEEFGKRVQKHLEEGQAEIERMKAEHAAKMQDWKKVKSLMQAEKRLRYAIWDEQEDAVPVFQLDAPTTNGHVEENLRQEKVGDVVKEVEDVLKVKIASSGGATRIARGGYRERKQPEYDEQALEQDNGTNGLISDQQHTSTTTSTPVANDMPSMQQAGSAIATPQTGEQQPLNAPVQAFTQPALNQPTPNTMGLGHDTHGRNESAGNALGDLPGVDMGDTLMDGMDLDVDHTDMVDFGDDNAEYLGGGNDTSIPQANLEAPAAIADATPAQPSATGTPSNLGPDVSQQQQTQPQQQPHTDLNADSGFGDNIGDTGDNSMFNDNTFDDLANLDGNDDGLIDFEGGGMGMDDSAFGDALHGMDDDPGTGTGGTPATGGGQ